MTDNEPTEDKPACTVELTTSDQYAFIGWVWTCTFHPDYTPEKPAFELIERLGDTGFGWRFDFACREGWAALGADALEFAEKNLLPLCSEFLRGCLLGDIRSRGGMST